MPPLDTEFGSWLRRQRKALDLTQEALGRLVSVSPHAIRKIESGERQPSRRLTERLASQLQIDANDWPRFLALARGITSVSSHGPLDHDDVAPLAEEDGHHAAQPTPFVGRADELRQLRVALARLNRLGGRTMLIEGEAGIGKSRLLHELCTHARQAGLPVALCKCYGIERELAYHALVDLLQQALASAPAELPGRLDPISRAELALLLPALAHGVDGLPQLSSELPQARQVRLLNSVLSLLALLSERHGMLMVLDDLQWLDDASAQALMPLVTHAARHRVLLVLACRSEDLRADPAVAALVDQLQAGGPLDRIELGALSRHDVAELVRGAAPGRETGSTRDAPADGDALVDRLYQVSQGNPLYFNAALADERQRGESPQHVSSDLAGTTPALPAPVQALVRSRLSRLGEPARQLLGALAVIGRGADYDLVQAVATAVATRSATPWMAALDELLLRRWIVDDAEKDEYTFEHDKLRDAVLAELSPTRKARLHQDVAQALAQRPDAPHAQIAEHFEQARQWPLAMQHRLRAGEQAERVFAVREAIAQYTHGLAAGAHGLPAPGAPQSHALLEQRGLAHAWLSEVDEAARDLRPAVNAALARGAPARAVELLTALGMSYQRADRYERGSLVLHQALALARELHDHKACAVVMFWLGDIEWSMDRNRASSLWFEQIMALHQAEQLDDSVLIMAHHGLGEVALLDARPQQALAHFNQSLTLAQRRGETRLVCENLILIAWAHQGASGTGHVESALAYCDQVSQLIAQADMPWYLSPTLVLQGVLMTAQGRFGTALQHFRQALDIARGIGMVRFETLSLVWLAECCLDAELPQQALRHIHAAKALMHAREVPFFSHQVCSIEAQALIRLQRLDEVPDLIAALARARDNQLGHSVLRTLESLAEWHAAHGRLDAAEQVARDFEAEALARSVPDMLHRAKAWQARLLETRGQHRQVLQQIERMLNDPTPPRGFSLRLDLQRMRHRCAKALGQDSATEYGQVTDTMLSTLASAALLIEAFSP